jgi:hypothetical protein
MPRHAVTGMRIDRMARQSHQARLGRANRTARDVEAGAADADSLSTVLEEIGLVVAALLAAALVTNTVFSPAGL